MDGNLSNGIKEYSNYLGVISQIKNDVLDMKNGFIKNDPWWMQKILWIQ
ncbi:hypothetical protein [Pseudogracilibacillus sp. SO30301A]